MQLVGAQGQEIHAELLHVDLQLTRGLHGVGVAHVFTQQSDFAAGERLAADGEIASGTGRFDQSLLTGESAPVPAGPGQRVLGGGFIGRG